MGGIDHICEARGFYKNAGQSTAMAACKIFMLALKVRLPEQSLACSRFVSPGTPPGNSVERSGFRSALLKVVRGVPIQMPITARERNQPIRTLSTHGLVTSSQEPLRMSKDMTP